MNWTSTKEFKERLKTLWEKGRFFCLESDTPPMLRYSLRGPVPRSYSTHSGTSRWGQSWQDYGAANMFELEWQEKAHPNWDATASRERLSLTMWLQ